jgi:hypothetical protein
MKPDTDSLHRSKDAVRPELNDQFHAAVNKDDKPVPVKGEWKPDAVDTVNIPASANSVDGGTVSDY